MTAALVLLCAMLLDAAFGEPDALWSRAPHPAVLMGRAVGRLEKKFNHGAYRRLKGCLCLTLLVVFGVLVGRLVSALGPVAETLCVAVLLAHRSLVDHVSAVSIGLRRSLKDGRQAVAMIVSRDTEKMDQDQVVRAAIESGAENFSDGVVAPAFWFLVGGAPGIVVYKIVNTADSMIGYRTEKYEEFGWAAARTDDLLNLIPARLSAALIVLSSARWSVSGLGADAKRHRSPNAGWPESAMARALGISLSGPRAYDGKMHDYPWVNAAGRKDLSSPDIDASVAMLWRAWGATFTLCALVGFILS
ncbi:MAG: adenosylcobinamide-phosphate synthase CbiB [Roseobacter sp.]|jgi:adenosylcobinamide-phosphate synthase